MKNLIICGDSFNIGIGCRDLINEPYGALLANRLKLNQINLAKGSSTNLSIYLQAKYVVENIKNIEFVFLSVTSYDRTEWIAEPDKTNSGEITNLDINYHQYPPYGDETYISKIPSVMSQDPNYNGSIFTDNYHGIFDYVDNFLDKNVKSGYYARFHNERPERARLLKQYYLEIYDIRLKRLNDIGVITMAHLLLKNNNIKHLILTQDSAFNPFISSENLVNVDWGQLSLRYPDDLLTLHTSKDGHIVAQNIVLNKLVENNWINMEDNIQIKPTKII
jgi:hypothetical protein